MKPKNFAVGQCRLRLYVGLGYLTFQVAYAISGDSGCRKLESPPVCRFPVSAVALRNRLDRKTL